MKHLEILFVSPTSIYKDMNKSGARCQFQSSTYLLRIVLFGLHVLWGGGTVSWVSAWLSWVFKSWKRDTPPHLQPPVRTGRQGGRGLDEILLWVFVGDVLRVRRVAEGEVLAVFLFDALHFLVSIRLLFPVEVSAGYRQDHHDDEDHHCDDACKVQKIHLSSLRKTGEELELFKMQNRSKRIRILTVTPAMLLFLVICLFCPLHFSESVFFISFQVTDHTSSRPAALLSKASLILLFLFQKCRRSNKA